MNRFNEQIWSIQNTAPYCNGLLEAFKVLDENYDEKEYLNGLCDSIRTSVEDSKIADAALENILGNNDFEGYWTEWGTEEDGIHDGDIIWELDGDKDREKFKKMLKNYGFVLEDDEDGLWITGVKE